MVVPAPIVAEVGYLLHRKGSPRAESAFLRSLAAGDFRTVELTSDDYARMADLVDTYADLPLGTSDASVVALAERLGVTEVATLDHRHFRVVRPRHVDAFTLLRDVGGPDPGGWPDAGVSGIRSLCVPSHSGCRAPAVVGVTSEGTGGGPAGATSSSDSVLTTTRADFGRPQATSTTMFFQVRAP